MDRRPKGVTLIEILIVAGLIAVVGTTFLYYARQRARTQDTDQTQAAYYLAVGSFLERFQADARMARAIRLASPSYFLDLHTANGTETITYLFRTDGTIDREWQGKHQVFSFGLPLKKGERPVFSIKEVGP